MKYFLFIFSFALLSCGNDGKNEAPTHGSEPRTAQTNSLHGKPGCTIADVTVLLENQNIQKSFFDQVQKWRLSNDKRSEFLDDQLFVSLSKEKLVDFLTSFKSHNEKNDSSFLKVYEFNAFPKKYKSSAICKDHISLHFDKDRCSFIIIVKNSFFVNDFGCSEHDVIYSFQIHTDQVNLINITGAG